MVAIAKWLMQHISRPQVTFRLGLLVGFLLLVSGPALYFNHLILSDPPRAPWTDSDRVHFIDGPLAGYGVVDAAAYLREQARHAGRIVVVKRTDNTKRLGAWRYYLASDDILLVPVNLKYSDPKEMIETARMQRSPLYVVLDRPWEDRYVQLFVNGPFAPYSRLVATFSRIAAELKSIALTCLLEPAAATRRLRTHCSNRWGNNVALLADDAPQQSQMDRSGAAFSGLLARN